MTPDKTTFSAHEMHAICIKSDERIARLEAEIERLERDVEVLRIGMEDRWNRMVADNDRAEAAEAELQKYKETFALLDYCIDCGRWAHGIELEHLDGCEKGK